MMSDEQLDEILNGIGEEILGALAKVAQAAQTEISSSNMILTSPLVTPSNCN